MPNGIPELRLKPYNVSKELYALRYSGVTIIEEQGQRGGFSKVAIPDDQIPMLIAFLNSTQEA